ncbi:MAG TPA: hypothetical protein VH678_33430 [Xanthobacteraceae bacterium]|jgi:hypothetical protein
MRGKIAPETFKKLVLIAVIAAGAECCDMVSSVDGLANAAAVASSGAAAAGEAASETVTGLGGKQALDFTPLDVKTSTIGW